MAMVVFNTGSTINVISEECACALKSPKHNENVFRQEIAVAKANVEVRFLTRSSQIAVCVHVQ